MESATREIIRKTLNYLNDRELLNTKGSRFKKYPFGFLSHFTDEVLKHIGEKEVNKILLQNLIVVENHLHKENRPSYAYYIRQVLDLSFPEWRKYKEEHNL